MSIPADDDLWLDVAIVGGGSLLFVLGVVAGMAGQKIRSRGYLDEQLEAELIAREDAFARRDRREALYRRGVIDALVGLGARESEPAPESVA